jgi:DNA polymerase-3 subunit chi
VTDVLFHHLERQPLEQALPRLLEATLAAGRRAVVVAGSAERVEALAGQLWTYDQDSWLPHGTARDGFAEDQPIWITAGDDNPNGATDLYLTDGVDSARIADFERCFDLFDGNDEAARDAARQRWLKRKAEGHAVSYWRQTTAGWDRKA